MCQNKLQEIRKVISKENVITLTLPNKFTFKDHDIYDFDTCLSFFDWNIHDCSVKIDLTKCTTANYQALSLLVLYAWRLKDQGCRVTIVESDIPEGGGASAMWKK